MQSQTLKTKPMFIQKVTEEARKKNSNTLDKFVYSLFDTNILGVKHQLSEKGVFMGLSKEKFLAKLNTLFSSIKEKGVQGAMVHVGVSLDVMPGCEVVEIAYAFTSEYLGEYGIYFREIGSPARKNEMILRFALKFNEGQITQIKQCRNVISKHAIGGTDSGYEYN